MEFKIGIWVQLKSDASKVYRVYGQSVSAKFLECSSLQGERISISADKVEPIINDEELADLEFNQTSSAFLQ